MASPRSQARLLVVDFAGHPFQYDLSVEFGARGHEVTHTYATSPHTPHSSFPPATNVAVLPVDLGHEFQRYKLLPRLRDELLYGWKTLAVARAVRPTTVITSNVPLVSLFVIWLWAATTRTRWVLWLQDLQSGLVGMVTGRAGFVTRTMRALEFFLIRRAAHVVAISDGMADALLAEGLARGKTTVIENWAPLDSMPERPRRNGWSSCHDLDDKFVFLYSGTLGVKHSPELLKALAEEFADDHDVKIVVVGEGPGADWLRSQDGPSPVQFDFQPFDDLPDVLATADVLVVLLDPEAGAMSVPSKTLSYLCAGRAVLGSIPERNAAAEVVAERACAGVVVPAGDVARFCEAARRLRGDSTARRDAGRNARRYAEQHFRRDLIADRFEPSLFPNAHSGKRVRT